MKICEIRKFSKNSKFTFGWSYEIRRTLKMISETFWKLEFGFSWKSKNFENFENSQNCNNPNNTFDLFTLVQLFVHQQIWTFHRDINFERKSKIKENNIKLEHLAFIQWNQEIAFGEIKQREWPFWNKQILNRHNTYFLLIIVLGTKMVNKRTF